MKKRGWNLIGEERKKIKNKWVVWDKSKGKAIHEIRKCMCSCNRNFLCKINSIQKFIHGHNSRCEGFYNREGFKKGQGYFKNKKMSDSHKNKLSLSHKDINKGSKCNFWKGGITPLRDIIKELDEYESWRKGVLKRDNYTCQECSTRGCYLEAHHIEEFYMILNKFLNYYNQFSPIEDKETLVRLSITWRDFWNVDNGKTLCNKCHNKTKKGKPC